MMVLSISLPPSMSGWLTNSCSAVAVALEENAGTWVNQLFVAAAPRELAPSAPMLAENFETELNASLKALFGR